MVNPEVDADGFVAVANGQRPKFACPAEDCGRSDFSSLSGLKSHWRRKHPDEEPPDWTILASGYQAPSVDRPPPIAPPPGATRDMKALQQELTESISGVGALVAGLLAQYKESTVTYQAVHGKPFTVRGRQMPYLETTFGHVVASHAPLSAKLLCQYAENNSVLYALLEGFNKMMHGGEAGQVVIAHVVGLAHTMAPGSERVNQAAAMFVPEQIQKVMEENTYLRTKIAQMTAQQQPTGWSEDDERGAGN